jgi:two-component system phosphate regulon response regulator PhoB
VIERVIIIGPERTLRESICLHLALEGSTCEHSGDGRKVLEAATTKRFSLIVMDLGSPEAFSTCQRLRSQPSHRRTPILLMTTPALENDAVAALEQWADDYIVAPVGLRELVARARALIRRSRMVVVPQLPAVASVTPPSIVRSRLDIDPARRRVHIDGRELKLTEHEFQLLYVLAARAGVVFDRTTLLSKIWGSEIFVATRSVDALIKRLRRRFRLSGHPDHIITIRHVGYKFTDSPDESTQVSTEQPLLLSTAAGT